MESGTWNPRCPGWLPLREPSRVPTQEVGEQKISDTIQLQLDCKKNCF